jgi:hypothetical protein
LQQRRQRRKGCSIRKGEIFYEGLQKTLEKSLLEMQKL